MSEHTAAPWQVTKICEGNYQIEREHGVNQIEAIGTVILKENTKLIAAAPELLEALKILMEWQVKNVDKWHNSAYDHAAEIIAKAEGQR